MPTVPLTPLPRVTQAALERSLARYQAALGQDFVQQATDRLIAGVRSILNPVQVQREPGAPTVTEGATPATVRADINDLLKRFEDPAAIAEELDLDFKIQVAEEVSRGAGRYVQQNASREELDAYPALELLRVYDRHVPRGDEPGGEDNDWPSRWRAAAQASGDTDALRMLDEHDRMIALKASPIWSALGEGVGGYDDTLGNPFPPFAFNSGMDCDPVDRAECEELGLLQPGQFVPAADINLNELFALS
mgnify:CR=1 FL=1